MSIMLAIVGAVATLGGIGASLWAVSRTKGIQLTLTMMSAANDELRNEVTDSRHRHETCRVEVAKLQGELEMLAGGLAERLVDIALKHMKKVE